MKFPSWAWPWRSTRIPVLRLHGVLAARGPLNIETFGPLIDRAFRAAGRERLVLLDVDSPGGSPVQSDLIAARIRRRASEGGIRTRAIIAETGASGGYWLACAADEIVAHPMSIVGSIGVIGGGFGVQDAIARIGIERRLYTAGRNKARLDPFSPERPEDRAFVQTLLDELHTRFKDWVRTSRGARLVAPEDTIFDGSYMLGEKAMAVGLVDRLGDLDQEIRAIGGKRARALVIKPKRRGLLGRLPRMAVDAALDRAEARLATPDVRF